MATTEGQITPGDDVEQDEVAEDPRDAWLTLALADINGGAAAALATAARGGRPLPKRES